MPEVTLAVTSGDGSGNVGALFRWLRSDLRVQYGLKPELRSEAVPEGTMGAADLIHVVLDHGEAIAALATAVAAWFGTLRRRPALRVERDGVVVTLADVSEERLRSVLNELLTGLPAEPAENEGGEEERDEPA
ncbi:effector-associated constant component EACC1 [Thermomonospora umbrina]|uniref:Uncharacterized protein n=1 Tax=Thermomonospora umbrina TaxID=111806 RepID=A0A3D9TAL1_9ACTN|nr:hypothetical protein [Thermomonospora umbrina]REF00802.1 hypothetical protein DFJ69_6384 [Thermomonospora umbrina]